MRRYTTSVLTVALILAAAVVRFGVAPRTLERLQPGDQWQAEYVGVTSYADEKTGTFPPATAGRYIRVFTAAAAPQEMPAVVITDTYTIVDSASGKITYQYIYRDTVDRRTGGHADAPHAGEVYVLPRFTEKAEYRLRASYLEGLPLHFEADETVAGLDTYIFSFRGRAEYTEAYGGTSQYPGIEVAPDQEIRCADDQFVFRAWVEPVTGDMVKIQESCLSGDYVYERATGRPLTPIMAWGGETSGDDVVRRAEAIRAERLRILLATRWVPGGLLLAALIVAGAGWARGRRGPL